MKNKALRVLAIVFTLVFVMSLGVIKTAPVAAADEMSEEAKSLKDNLEAMLKQFKSKEEVDSYMEELLSYYGEEISEDVNKMYAFLYDWVEIKKEIGDYKDVAEFSYEEADGSAQIASATMRINCKDGEATINYVTKDDDTVEITIEKKSSFGELMKNAALNTVLGMGTVFIVLIFISLLISCFSLFNKKETAPVPAAAAPAAPVQVEPEVDEDVTDDTELVAVISAAIAAAEGTSAEGFQVRSIKRVRNSNW